MLSIETTTKLLKLHLQWPERKSQEGRDTQALEFYKWLFINHHDKPEVMDLNDVELVEEFLHKNSHVLWPSLKEEEKWANLRLEPRIEHDVTVDMTVVECEDLALIGASVFGRTLDLGLHGMRLTVNEDLPAGTIVNTRVTPDIAEDKIYHLQAEVRWSSALEDGYLIGIKLKELKDFSNWQNNFGAEFVTPAMSRNR